MNDHIGETNEMISDTPISDSTPHNVADLGMLCRKLERELNAANGEIERLTAKVVQLYAGAKEQKQRIKRLEEALDKTTKIGSKHIKRLEEGGDKAILNSYLPDRLAVWNEAKEAKL